MALEKLALTNLAKDITLDFDDVLPNEEEPAEAKDEVAEIYEETTKNDNLDNFDIFDDFGDFDE